MLFFPSFLPYLSAVLVRFLFTQKGNFIGSTSVVALITEPSQPPQSTESFNMETLCSLLSLSRPASSPGTSSSNHLTGLVTHRVRRGLGTANRENRDPKKPTRDRPQKNVSGPETHTNYIIIWSCLFY